MPNETTDVISMDEHRARAPWLRGARPRNNLKEIGETALAMAVARWNEADGPDPLFADRYAPLLVTAACESGWRPEFLTLSPDSLSRIGPILSARIQALHDYAACRTRFFDEFFKTAASNGINQAVLVGSGLDARAWRLPWPVGATVFDVDQPNILDFKISSLWAANAAPRCEYRPAAVDLRTDWTDLILDAGFDPKMPTAWSAEGAMAYLPGPDRDRLFRNIRRLSAPGSKIAVEAASPSRRDAMVRQRRIRETREAAAAAGHPFLRETRSLWDTSARGDLAGELRIQHWRTSETEAEDLMAMYGRAPSSEALGVTPSSVFVEAITPMSR